VAGRYLEAKKPTLRPSTFKAAERYLRGYWKKLHATPIGSIKRADIAAILQEITAKNGRIAAARARSNLSALFAWSMGEGLCDSNPTIKTNDPARGILARERVLDPNEIRAIWSACLDDSFGRIVKLLILCGCRRGEIGDLKWSEANTGTGVITILGDRTKNGRTLSLTLSPMAIEILRSAPRLDEQPFVFGKNGHAGFNAWSYSLIALNSRIATSGQLLSHWTLHDLRRTVRTGMGMIGVAPHIAELVLGHSKKGMIAVYDKHNYGPEIKTALLRWADHVASILEDKPSNVVSWPA
jgi:integrase